MKKIILFLTLLFTETLSSQTFVEEQILLDAGNISSWFQNTGRFNTDIRVNNTPGLIWPKDSIKKAVFTTGFNIAAKVNDSVRMASTYFQGEFRPGYCINGQFFTDIRFKFYKVTKGDNYINNPDWVNWGLMVPYGAPYIDVDNNGMYDYLIDTPGVRNSAQTIFICLTDANPESHSQNIFGGGTSPLGAEVHFTGWVYNTTNALRNIQFMEWEVVNKSSLNWNGFYSSIICDPDLGFGSDDFIGCDSSRNLGICYNADNFDGTGILTDYGENPPAFGLMFLTLGDLDKKMTSFVEQVKASGLGAPCERNTYLPISAYNFMRGLKTDETPHVVPLLNPVQITKYLFSGDPETNSGWNYPTGKVFNCEGSLTGDLVAGYPSDKRFIISNGSDDLNILPGQKRLIFAAQLITRGNNNLNAVTVLKQLADTAIRKSQEITLSVNLQTTGVPKEFNLYQNYPNPFNPTTKIRFDIPVERIANPFYKLAVYDATGREVAVLLNESLSPGSYEVKWSALEFSSGIYFYELKSDNFSDVKRMVLLK